MTQARRGLEFNIRVKSQVAGIKLANGNFRKLSATVRTNTRLLKRNQMTLDKMAATMSLMAKNMGILAAKQKANNITVNRNTTIVNRNTRAKAKNAAATRAVNKQMSGGLNIVNRLATAMVVFAAAGGAVRGFVAMVESAIEFNKNIEGAKLGIAALITASGVLLDEQGAMVGVAEKFAWAQEEAGRQTQKLRMDALATEATFAELMDVFQLAIAPGLSGGLDLDEIRKFTIRISQAATALQMPQRQLAEEVRSILRGNIRLQSTRIAAALQITNQQVHKWRAMGVLGEKLFQKFAAFGEASAKLKETWAGLSGRVSDAFQQLTGTAGLEFFEKLKEMMRLTFKSMVNITKQGIELDEGLVRAFKHIFDALTAIVDHFRKVAGFVKGGQLDTSFKQLAFVLEKVGKFAIDFFAGVLAGVRTFGKIVKLFAQGGDSLKSWGIEMWQVVAGFTAVYVTSTLISATLKTMVFFVDATSRAMKLIVTTSKTFRKVLITMLATVRKIGLFLIGPWGVLLAAIGLISTAINKFVQQGLGTSFDLVGQMVVGFETMGVLAKKIGETLVIGIKNAWKLIENLNLAIPTFINKAKLLAERTLLERKIAEKENTRKFIDRFRTSKKGTMFAHKEAMALKKLTDRLDDINLKLQGTDIRNTLRGLESLAKPWETLQEDIAQIGENYFKNFDDHSKSSGEKIKAYLQKKMKGLTGDPEDGGLFSDKSALGGIMKFIDEALFGADKPEDPPKDDPEKKITALVKKYRLADVQVGDLLDESQLSTLEEATTKATSLRDKFAQAQEIVSETIEKLSGIMDTPLPGEATEEQKAERIVQRDMLNQMVENQKRLNKAKEVELMLADKAAEKAELAFELLKLEAEGDMWSGMTAGMLKFADKTKSVFELTSDFIESTMMALADTVSSLIVDAFDPTKDVDIEARFAKMMKGIAQVVIKELMAIAIARAFAMGGSVGTSDAGSGSGSLVIPDFVSTQSAAIGGPIEPFARARGLAHGGRPKGLHPSDTVPIWAAPGEFMMRVSAVRKYGAGVMAKINAGLIDPSALQGVAGLTSRKSLGRTLSRRGYAEGGGIPGRSPSTPAAPGRAVIVANDAAAERLLAGGRGAVLRFFHENQDDINGALST